MINIKERPDNFRATSEVSFAHYRNLDSDLRTPSAQGGISVAYQYELVDTLMAGVQLMVRIGIAVCHENDNFDRKIGRNLALARLRGEPEEVPQPFQFKKTKVLEPMADDKAPAPAPIPAPKLRTHNHEMTITQVLDGGPFNRESEEDIEIVYGPTGDMRVPLWVNSSIETMVRNYLEANLFENILAREGVDISGVSEDNFEDESTFSRDSDDLDDDDLDDLDDDDDSDEDEDEDDAAVTPARSGKLRH